MGDSTIIPWRDEFGLAFSIVGLALVVIIQFVIRHSWRFLDYLQFCYIFATVATTSVLTFSAYLDDSWIEFIPNFLTFCKNGDYVCTTGYALGFLACLIAFLIILALVTIIERFRKPSFRFQTVYNALKGLFRWAFIPICFYSFYFLIKAIKNTVDNQTMDQQIIPSAIVSAIFVLGFPLAQLITLTIFSREDVYKWNKVVQFAQFLRIQSVCLLSAFALIYQTKIPFYIMYVPFLGYDIFYLILQQFPFKIYGRINYLAGSTLFIALFSLFLFKPQYIRQYDLDFFFLAVIMIIDICFYIVRFVHLLTKSFSKQVNPDDEPQQANPELGFQHSNSQIKMPPQKKQQTSSGENLMNSRDNISNDKPQDRYGKPQRRRR